MGFKMIYRVPPSNDRPLRNKSHQERLSNGQRVSRHSVFAVAQRNRMAWPQIVLGAVVCFFMFKLAASIQLGTEAYASSVHRLTEGTTVQAVSARFLDADPITMFLHGLITMIF